MVSQNPVKLALLPQSAQNRDLQTSRYSDERVAVSESLCSQQGQNVRKPWKGTQYFVSVESVAKENPCELRGF